MISRFSNIEVIGDDSDNSSVEYKREVQVDKVEGKTGSEEVREKLIQISLLSNFA
jgi:hypothetical protein